MSFRDNPKFKRGRNGEQIIAQLLKEKGWFVIPSYDYSGQEGDKAPKMQGAVAAFVIPDLDIAKLGERRWAEVKTKKEPTLYKKTNVLEHGIPLRHFEDYKKVQAETGCEVWLFVYEELSRDVLCLKLNDLGDGRKYTGNKMSRGGMIFWPRSKFRKLCRLPILSNAKAGAQLGGV